MNLLKPSIVLFASLVVGCSGVDTPDYVNSLRPSAVPLITVDPYVSVWSFGDCLNDSPTLHWTGSEHPLVAAVRVDGKSYRIVGKEDEELTTILPMENWQACYTLTKPSEGWLQNDFDDSSWSVGNAPFGSADRHPATLWDKDDIWIRRTFDLQEDLSGQKVCLVYSHDDVFNLYINGVQVVDTGNKWRDDVRVELGDQVLATMSAGKVTIAAQCHNTTGGAYVDFGLYKVVDNSDGFENAAVQKSVNVLPTSTIYTFECGPVEVEAIFTAPMLADDLDLLSTPVNYLSFNVVSTDGAGHDVQMYVESSPLMAVNKPNQPVECSVGEESGLKYVKAGTVEQNVLGRKGDNVRIDWGYFYMASANDDAVVAVADYFDAKRQFSTGGEVSAENTAQQTIDMTQRKVALCYCRDLGMVGQKGVSDMVMLAYDEEWSVQYFEQNLRPYWNRGGESEFVPMLANSWSAWPKIQRRCNQFDSKLLDELVKAGGKEYADVCALVYRQAFAAHTLVEDSQGNLLFFSKENFSNGSIGTVDITYPSSPLFLLLNPELVKGMMNPIFHYSESGRWTKPFAAHDVGTYPLANGQTYGGDMPVEESGNMLILADVIARLQNRTDYIEAHWEVMSVWADYLVKEGLDPANQLCTDDFAGHFAHNTNLSIKAITGIACYADMARMTNRQAVADKYEQTAKQMAKQWQQMAFDGDHYRLTFDKQGTWSQKYNLVWDRLLRLDLFDSSVAATETAYYLTKQNEYGLPLDSRKSYTKSDWIMWTACLADSPNDFKALTDPVYHYINTTQSRIPVSDWHDTQSGLSVGFRARSVVGGYYLKLLEEKMMNQ